MNAKNGFILRNIVGEFFLMPTGENISTFGGTVILNEVSAFIWEKLQTPVTKREILNAILSEFEVEESTAETDLNEAIILFRKYNLIEE